MRVPLALRGRQPPQPRCLREILRDALALKIGEADCALRGRVALQRGQPIQSHGLDGVHFHAAEINVRGRYIRRCPR
jgi:hypothetical protein